MKVTKVQIKTSRIEVSVLIPEDEGTFREEPTLRCQNRPHDEFSQAFAALAPVFAEMFEVSPKFAGSLTITGLFIADDEEAGRTARISASREFRKVGRSLSGLKTPSFHFDDEGAMECKEESAILINKALDAALSYYQGERQAILLSGEREPTAAEEDDPNQGTIEFPTTASGN